MEKKVTLLDRVCGLLLMLILWVLGSLFCALGVTFLPVIGLFIGLSLILVGTWFGLYMMRPELYAPFESNAYEFKEEALSRETSLRSAMAEEKGIEHDFLQAA